MEEIKKSYQSPTILSFLLIMIIAISLLWAAKEFIAKKRIDILFDKVYFAEYFDYGGENKYGI